MAPRVRGFLDPDAFPLVFGLGRVPVPFALLRRLR